MLCRQISWFGVQIFASWTNPSFRWTMSCLIDIGKEFISFKLLEVLALLGTGPIKFNSYRAGSPNGKWERFYSFLVTRLVFHGMKVYLRSMVHFSQLLESPVLNHLISLCFTEILIYKLICFWTLDKVFRSG